jgi:hypothetical protein
MGMPWWGWIVVGAILLGSELFFIEAEFFLVFIGLSAAATGLAVLGFPGLAPWLQWLLFAALALGSMALFRRRVYQKLRPAIESLPDDLAGVIVRVPVEVAPGESCRIEYRGSTWSARNDGPRLIAAGSRGRILGTDGITLRIEGAD